LSRAFGGYGECKTTALTSIASSYDGSLAVAIEPLGIGDSVELSIG